MALSSNTLFHFTNKNALLGIIKDKFKIKYCFETVETHLEPFEFGIPMVSFCDIPLSEVKDHMSKYGSYGIGMKKKWAKQNGLNPVLYIDQNSSLIRSYHHIYNNLLENRFVLSLNENEQNLVNIVRYFKNYQADLKRKNGTITKDYKFADEREWRYVPDANEIQMLLSPKNYRRVELLNDLKEPLENLRLNFEIMDIAYIIVNDESEILDLIIHLKKIFKSIDISMIENLISKILTKEQIHNDF
jgi:hypothetical protein